MSLRDDLIDDGRVLSAGSFKLDSRRATEKMAQYQLETPHRYVVELVAAAVRAGATTITMLNDADDLVITWDGLHPTTAELDDLDSHVFLTGREDRERMLHHLSVGLLGAHGLSPKSTRLERPGLAVELVGLRKIGQVEIARAAGVLVHVRERFGWPVLLEALPGQVPRETVLLRAEAWTCPVPLTVNGTVVAGTTATAPRVPDDRPLVEVDSGRVLGSRPAGWQGVLWLGAGHGVTLVRDGVVVHTVDIGAGPLVVVGSVRADGLALNASKSKVVEDDTYQTLLDRLVAARIALLAAGVPGVSAEALRRERLSALSEHPAAAAPLAALPVFRDSVGHAWSLAELRALRSSGKGGAAVDGEPAILVVSHDDLLDPSLVLPQFRGSLPPSTDGAPTAEWPALVACCGGQLRDGDALLTERREARTRRAELAAHTWPLEFPEAALLQRRFSTVLDGGDPMQGTLAIGLPGADQLPPGLHLELRVEGLPVETLNLAHPGTLLARVESPALHADARFARVERDRGYAAALALTRSEANLLLADLALHHFSQPRVQATLSQWLDALTRDPPESGLPDALLDAPILDTLSGQQLSVRAVQTRAAVDRDASVRWVRRDARLDLSGFRPHDSADPDGWRDTLELDADQARSLRRLIGRRLVDMTEPLMVELEAAARRAEPPEQPTVVAATVARAPFEASGLRGEVAILAETTVADMAVRVLHQGVPLGTVVLAVGRPGAAAAIEWDGARPTPSWGGLENASTLSDAVGPALVTAFDALVERTAAGVHAGGILPRWLVANLSTPGDPPASLLGLPLFRSLDGASHSLTELASSKSRVGTLLTAPNTSVPGFDHCLLVDADRVAILRARLGEKRLSDARPALAKAERKWSSFWQRDVVPPAVGPGHAGVVTLRGESLRGEVGVRTEPDTPGHLVVRLLHQGRVLLTTRRPSLVPASAVLDGDDIVPNARADGLAEQVDQDRLWTAVDDALARSLWLAVDGALDGDRRTEPAPPHVLRRVTRALLSGEALPDGGARRLAQLRASPLLPLLSGGGIDLRRAAEESRAGRLRTVAPNQPDGPVPSTYCWIVLEREVGELLSAALDEPTPDASRELMSMRAGLARWRSLPEVPLCPPGAWVASMRLRDEQTQAWVGLLSGDSTQTVEWLVDQKVVARRSRQEAGPGLLIRVTHPGLQASASFDDVRAGPARERCRALVDGLPDRFLLAVARRLDGQRSEAQVTSVEACRPAVVRQAAGSRHAAWNPVPLVQTSEGKWLTRVEVRALAADGPLRLVSPGHTGRTLDDRPAVQASEGMFAALRAFGPAVSYDAMLDRDQDAWRRRTARPVQHRPLPTSQVAVRIACPRDGDLAVPLDGIAAVTVHVGWRPLTTLRPAGPVPLAGAVNDPAVRPKQTFDGLEDDAAATDLRGALDKASHQALHDLVEAEGVPLDAPLWMSVLSRTFSNASQVRRAKGVKGRLADLPLFLAGDGSPLTARQVAVLAGGKNRLRWTPPGEDWLSLDANRPFVRLPLTGQSEVRGLMGGRPAGVGDARDAARARMAKAPPAELALPARRYLAQTSGEVDGLRHRLALSTDPTEPCRINWRVRNRSVSVRDVRLDGVVGTIELPVEQLGDDGESATLRRDQQRALVAVRSALVADSASAVRSNLLLRWKIAGLLSSSTKRDAAWWEAPLIVTPGGSVSLDALSSSTCILAAIGEPDWGDEEQRPPVILRNRVNLALLEAAGLSDVVVSASAWLADRRAVAERKRAERLEIEVARSAAARRAARTRALEPRVNALVAGLSQRSDLIERALDSLPADGLLGALDPSSVDGWVLAWWVVDTALGDLGRAADAAAVAARAGEHIASLTTSEPSR